SAPTLPIVIAGLDPAISLWRARCLHHRDARAKPAHDESEFAATVANKKKRRTRGTAPEVEEDRSGRR
ncbi:MAG: hypothetical protein WA418_18290, partial [Bradyrhizobium sp.]